MELVLAINEKDEKDYKYWFNELKSQIRRFQNVEYYTSAFQFFDQCSPYSLTATHKEEIKKQEYPNLWDFDIDFQKLLGQFNYELEKLHGRSKSADTKIVAKHLFKSLEDFSATLEYKKVKEKILSEFTDENRYKNVEHFGIQMKEPRPFVWQDFTTDLLDKDYLFDEYIDWMYSMFKSIDHLVETFEKGYPKETSKQKGKSNPTRDNFLKLGIIKSDKWEEFYNLCNTLSQTRTFKIGREGKKESIDAVVIKHCVREDKFEWKGIGTGVIPSLAQFIKSLEENEFFSFPQRMRLTVCSNYLSFFGLKTDKEQVKYLSKEIDNMLNNYVDAFKPNTFY